MKPGSPPVVVRLLMIVRRGATDKFQLLSDEFAGEPVRVAWDRRIAERRCRLDRASADRRQTDRRGPLPDTWNYMDFLVVHEAPRPGGPQG